MTLTPYQISELAHKASQRRRNIGTQSAANLRSTEQYMKKYGNQARANLKAKLRPQTARPQTAARRRVANANANARAKKIVNAIAKEIAREENARAREENARARAREENARARAREENARARANPNARARANALTYFGLNNQYTNHELKAIYHKLAMEKHPNKGGTNINFQLLGHYYDRLKKKIQ